MKLVKLENSFYADIWFSALAEIFPGNVLKPKAQEILQYRKCKYRFLMMFFDIFVNICEIRIAYSLFTRYNNARRKKFHVDFIWRKKLYEF